MKREVAIEGLKAFRREFSGYKPNEEMLDMAIKALEQETVSKESYDHEYCMRKMFELKIYELECRLAEQAEQAVKAEQAEQAEQAVKVTSILGKIRDEILQLKTKTSFTFVNIDDVLRLIDKHIESKENEMTSKFKIRNPQDKENCFKEFEKLVNNKIWVELINKQHDHLEVEIEIKVLDKKENQDGKED